MLKHEATLSGNIFLDADATVSEDNAGGLLVLSGAQLDLKNQTMTVTGSGDTTISGVLQQSTGAGRLTKSGTGVLTLNGANSYTGATSINGGTAKLGNATALGTTGSTTTVATNATLDLNGQTIAEGRRGDRSGRGRAFWRRSSRGHRLFIGIRTLRCSSVGAPSEIAKWGRAKTVASSRIRGAMPAVETVTRFGTM